MKQRGFFLLMAGLVGTAIFVARPVRAGAPPRVPSDAWMGLYLAGQKMGYLHLTVDKASFEGKDCYKVRTLMRTKMVLLGASVQQDVDIAVYTNERFSPLFETFEMSSGGSKTVIEARFGDKDINCRVSTGESKSSKTVPIPPGASLIGDSMYALGTDKVEVGRKAKMHYFNPMTLAVEPVEVEVLRTEQVEVKGKTYDTFVLKNATPMGDVTTWQTEDGTIVKSVAILGLTMLIESPEEAMAGVDSGYTPPADLAAVSSVKANIDIPKPRDVRKLVIRLSGNLDPKMAITDVRQKAKWTGNADGSGLAEYAIESAAFDRKKSVKRPVRSEKLRTYLEPTPYLQSAAPEIRTKAAEIVGEETSAYGAASKIRAWVHGNMKPQADIGIARPAADVLRSKVGVCRDYAVLFASLARASGIPTKVVAGIVYMNGKFYYHAWAESYVGEWVPFDATLDHNFVDATHIKLAEGDATNMFDMARAFGSLKAEIVRFE